MSYDLWFLAISFISVYLLFGMFMGYQLDEQSKSPIAAILDGYLIALPLICMVGFGAPVVFGVFSIGVIIYSIGKIMIDGAKFYDILYNEVTGPGIVYFGYMLLVAFWVWFRSKVLGYKRIL
jgi:hypothetical protein